LCLLPLDECEDEGVDADEEDVGDEYREALDDASVATDVELPLLLSYRQLDELDDVGDENNFLSYVGVIGDGKECCCI
jgi:hypothetical protein